MSCFHSSSIGQFGDPGNALQFVVLEIGAVVPPNAMSEKLAISVSVSWIDSKGKFTQLAVVRRARNAGNESERIALIMPVSNTFQENVFELEREHLSYIFHLRLKAIAMFLS